jgi:microcystin degradation protein MlrC
MRIAVAGFTHETNTFAPEPTRLADFGARGGGGIPAGAAALERVEPASSFRGFCAAAAAAGHELVPVLHAFAPPGGTIERKAFDAICDRIVDGVTRARPLDAVFVELHGAMVADGVPDADAEVLRRVRSAVGPIPVVAALDSHANVGPGLVAAADALAAYRTYPHVDMARTGARVHALLEPLLRGGAPWERAHLDIPFLMPLCRQSTLAQPCDSLYAALEVLERETAGATLSFVTGFPLADVPQCRPSLFGYGPDEPRLRKALAELRARVLAQEPAFAAGIPGVDEAVALALREPRGPVVLADVQDNAGGGASSDTVWAIEALLRAGATDALVGLLFDPEAAAAAHAAGVGATLELALGGKRMPGHRPLHGRFVVEALRTERVLLRGPMMAGTHMDLGPMALLRVGGVRIVVCSRRAQCLDREYFRAFGLEPERHRLIVVKSTNHYRADFTPVAARIIEFAAPGACAMDPSQLAFRRLAPGTRTRPGHPSSAFKEPT